MVKLKVSLESLYFRSKKKESLWHDVGEVVLEHPPIHILLSLTHNTKEAGLNLRAKTAAIDIARDAEKLRYSLMYICSSYFVPIKCVQLNLPYVCFI